MSESNFRFPPPARVALIAIALAPIALASLARPAVGADIIPVSQERLTSITTFVDGCIFGESFQGASDQESAPGFELFDSALSALAVCDTAGSIGDVTQNTAIDATSLSGSMNAHLGAFAGAPPHITVGVVQSIFDVTFELPQTSTFTLTGLLDAASTGDEEVSVEISFALFGADGVAIVNHFALSSGSQPPVIVPMDDHGTLEPGSYTLTAWIAVGADLPPVSGIGDATIDFAFDLIEPKSGDLNSDGVVSILDLVEMLMNWGPCGTACAGDLNDDGTINVVDLLTMLANWG